MSSTKQLLEEEPSPAPLATRRESGMGEHAMDTLGLGILSYRDDSTTSRHLRDV